jgi:hypothetical protein
MAHNDYLKPGGVWVNGDVPTGTDLTKFDQRQYLSIHEGGGTWAPLTLITIGGLGLSVTGPFVASSANIIIPTGKTLSIASGGSFTTDGGATVNFGSDATFEGLVDIVNGAEVLLQSNAVVRVKNGALIDVQAGGELEIKSGGFLDVRPGASIDVHGTIAAKTGASIACEAGSSFSVAGTGLFVTGSTTTLGGTWNVASAGVFSLQAGSVTTIFGDPTVESGGSITWNTGSNLIVQAGGTMTFGGTFSADTAAQFTFSGSDVFFISAAGLFYSSTVTIENQAKTTQKGAVVLTNNGNIGYRIGTAPNSTTSYDPSTADIWEVATLTANRVHTLNAPSDPTVGSRHHFTRYENPGAGTDLTILRSSDSTQIARIIQSATGGSVDVYWHVSAAEWRATNSAGSGQIP